MVNEVMRILRNCSEYCPWKEVTEHISYFMKRLQFSGYDHQFRYDVTKAALKRHKAVTSNNRDGGTQKQNATSKNNWYQKNDDADAVMFVQATKDGQLKKELQRCADRNKLKLKMIEKVDNSIRKELQRSNPFKSETCGNERCRICQDQIGVNCRARGCIYEMICLECERKYRGQTGNSAQERIGQHFKDWKSKDTKCPLYRHSQLYHGGKEFKVGVKILKSCFGDPTTRKITEAVMIDELTAEETMNAKSEWTYVKLNKLTAH